MITEEKLGRLIEAADSALLLLETVMRMHYPDVVVDSRIEVLRSLIAELRPGSYKDSCRYRLTIEHDGRITSGNYNYDEGMEAWLLALRKYPPPAIIHFDPLV